MWSQYSLWGGHSHSMPMSYGGKLFTSKYCLGGGGRPGIIHLMNSDKSREDIIHCDNDTYHFVPVNF